MNVRRYWAKAELLFRGHVLNGFWRDRAHRRKTRKDAETDIVVRYVKRYLKAAADVPETKVEVNDNHDKIFTMWLQGEDNAPDIVKACFRSVRTHCSQELIVLDEKSLFDYIDLPPILVEKYKSGKIGRSHFSDLCRVELLYRYGGYWLDATAYVTSPIPEWISDQDFFVFLTSENCHIGGSPWSFMQNCFIRARKGAYLLAAWREMMFAYWMKEDKKITYFVNQLMFKTLVTNNACAKRYFEQMPHTPQDPTHLLWWSCKDKPFDDQKFKEITAGAFFQKTSYHHTEHIKKGSFADVMINEMNRV